MNSSFKNKKFKTRQLEDLLKEQKRQEKILKEIKENKKNKDFDLPKNLIYSFNQKKFWPGDIVEAWETLNSLTIWAEPYFLTSDLEEDQDIKEATKEWSREDFLQSSLFFVLQDWLELTNDTGSLFVSDFLWETVFSLSLNPKINLCTLIFVRNLKLFKISTTEEVVNGLLSALKTKNDTLSLLPFEKILERNALKNLLFLMNFKEGFIDILLKKAYEKRSLNELIDVLENTPLKINEDFVLRNDLKSFTEIQKDNKRFEQLQEIYEDLLDSKRDEMERFDIFDIFLSDENLKIKTSETLSLLFYQNLFYEISENKKVYLNLFLLFENYVFLKKKDYNLLSIFDRNELLKLIENFWLEEKNKIKKEEINQLSSFANRNPKMVHTLEKENKYLYLLRFFFPLLIICFSTVAINPPKAYAVPPLAKQAVVLNQPIGSDDKNITKAKTVTTNTTRSEKKEIQQKQEKKTQQQKVNVADLKERLVLNGFKHAHVTETKDKTVQCFDTGLRYNERKRYLRALEIHSAQTISNQALEFDHVLAKPIYNAAGLSYEDGFAVARSPITHRILTASQTMKWGANIKYKHGRDGMVKLLTSVVTEKTNLLESCVRNDPNFLMNEQVSLDQASDILRIGLSFEIDAYKKTVQNDFSWPVFDGIGLCNKAKRETTQLLTGIEKLVSYGINIEKAEEIFLTTAPQTKKLTQLVYSLNNLAPKETPNLPFLKIAHTAFVQEMEHIVYGINSFGGKISNQQKNDILYPKKSNLWDLDHVEDEVRYRFYLQERKQIRKPIWYKSQNLK